MKPAYANNEAMKYTKLPKIAKILHNIFVVEKKNVLMLDFVLEKLSNSYTAQLTRNELEEHVRLLCRVSPNWATIHCCRQVNYLKLAKTIELAKVIERLETEANNMTS